MNITNNTTDPPPGWFSEPQAKINSYLTDGFFSVASIVVGVIAILMFVTYDNNLRLEIGKLKEMLGFKKIKDIQIVDYC